MSLLFRQIMDFLMPPCCISCGSETLTICDLCHDCQKQMPLLDPGCERCHQSINDSASLCGECISNPPKYNKVFAPFQYKDNTKKLIIQLKFHQKLAPAKLLGSMTADYLCKQYKNEALPEAILPVPLHLDRLKMRGFNQAIEISKPIAKRFNIPILRHSVIRTKNTSAQAELPEKLRAINVRNAFVLKKPLPFKRIAILDDVYTTGQTIKSLSRSIHKQQKIDIDVWCVARAQRQ